MRKLPEVQEAKDLMNEAMEWSSFKWLFEKSRVRATADRANAALDRLNRSVKAQWSEEIKATHKRLSAKTPTAVRRLEKDPPPKECTDPETVQLLEKVIEADHAAHHARMDAEGTFDRAEKLMSTDLAREGCKKAIHSWESHEKAIRKAEAIANANRVAE
jgi:hypothetical protein